jgi:hypothetical protein
MPSTFAKKWTGDACGLLRSIGRADKINISVLKTDSIVTVICNKVICGTMTGAQSRLLTTGDRVCWNADKNDQGTVTEKSGQA